MKRYVRSSDEFIAGPTHPAIAKANLTPAMVKMLGTYHKHYKAGEEHKIFDMLHAYLQGLEDAGVISNKEHDSIFAEVMEID